jgi:hypothetical protein
VNVTNDQHLTDDQIIGAIIGADDLPDTIRNHLAVCPSCRLTVEQFEHDLSTLSELARHFSPRPKQRITLPVEKTTQSIFGARKWQFSLGAAFSAILVFVIIWWSGITNTVLNGGPNNLTKELWEDEALMSEISSLSENALPQLYLDITGDIEPEAEEEESFLDFIDPANKDTSLS